MEVKIINNRPVKIWTSNVEESAMRQIENLTTLPFLHHHLAIMPDVHAGMGMPIGGVLTCNGAVIPNAVGVDIGCGMCAVKTNWKVEALSPNVIRKEIMKGIRERIPLGMDHHNEAQDKKYLPQGYDIDKMEIVKLYKKWKTYTTKTFEPLESWLRDYDAWDSFSRYKYDEYLLTMLCGDLIPGINEGIITTSETSTNVLTNTDGKYERKMPCLTYGCDLLSCNFTSYKNEKGENSFEGKEIVIKQLNPDFKTYVIAKSTKRKQIGGVLEEGDSMVIAGENVKNLLGDGKVNYLNIVSVNHSSNTKDSHVTFEIRNKQINASVSPTELTFPAEGNTQSVKVTAQGFTRYNHKISDKYKEWLSAKNNPAGKMDITVQPNATGKERIGYVRVYVFNDENPTEAQKVYLKDSIKVTQAANKEPEQQESAYELVGGSINMYYAVVWRSEIEFKVGDDGVTITPNGKGAKVQIQQSGEDTGRNAEWEYTLSFDVDDLSLYDSKQAKISNFKYEFYKEGKGYDYYGNHVDWEKSETLMTSNAPMQQTAYGNWRFESQDLSYYGLSITHFDKYRTDPYSSYTEHTDKSETSEMTDGSNVTIWLTIKKK